MGSPSPQARTNWGPARRVGSPSPQARTNRGPARRVGSPSPQARTNRGPARRVGSPSPQARTRRGQTGDPPEGWGVRAHRRGQKEPFMDWKLSCAQNFIYGWARPDTSPRKSSSGLVRFYSHRSLGQGIKNVAYYNHSECCHDDIVLVDKCPIRFNSRQ